MYKITKEQCYKLIYDRMPVVCSYCGGDIEPIETVDNQNNPTFWSGCKKCQLFNWGTNPKIYKIAEEMVDNKFFRAYPFDPMPNGEIYPNEFDYWRKSQINGTVSIVRNILNLSKIFE